MENIPEQRGRPPAVPGFSIGRLLGSGGSATVWLATEQATGEEFALKVLQGVPEEGSGNDLQREIAILGRYRHEHLVRVHRVLQTDRGPGLLMDAAPGGSLAQLVSVRGPLSVGEVITVLTPVAQALDYLHGQGVTHTDVAPGNILFSALGKPLLSDLGLGRIVGEVRRGRRGTPGFMEPDPTRTTSDGGAGRQRPEADVFALGALGWFALTGRVPAASRQRPPLSVLVPAVPHELMVLIESALQEDASARPSAAEFAHAVFRTGEAAPLDLVAAVHPAVLPQLVTRRDRLPERRRRRRGLWKRGGRRPLLARYWAAALSTAALLTVLGVALLPRLGEGTAAGDTAAGDNSSRGTASAGAAATPGEPSLESPAPPSPAPQFTGPEPPATEKQPAAQPPEPLPQQPLVGQTPGAAPEELPEEALAGADPTAAVAALAALRAQAFRTGSFDLLDRVNTDGSQAMQADHGIARQLKASGHLLAGLRMTVTDLQPGPAAEDGRIPVRAVATTSGFTEVDAAGKPVRTKVGSTVQHLEFILEQVDGRWRISEVREAPA